MVWMVMALVFGAGCIGGATSLLTNRQEAAARTKPNFKSVAWGLLYKNTDCETLFLGPLGKVLVGGVAAVVFWGLYGPWADWPVLGGAPATPPKFTVAQLVAPVLMGYGGPDWLQEKSERWCRERTRRRAGAVMPA